MNFKAINGPTPVLTFIAFADTPIGFISVDTMQSNTTSYAYVPLRNGPHLKLVQALSEGGAEVSVRLKSGTILMTATELTAQSITLAVKPEN